MVLGGLVSSFLTRRDKEKMDKGEEILNEMFKRKIPQQDFPKALVVAVTSGAGVSAAALWTLRTTATYKGQIVSTCYSTRPWGL